jgi:hypothetical protein
MIVEEMISREPRQEDGAAGLTGKGPLGRLVLDQGVEQVSNPFQGQRLMR